MSNYKDIIPTLSPDTEIQSFDDATYLVYHSSLGYYLRVNKLMSDLLGLIDGKRDIASISNHLSEKFEINLTDNEVYNQLFKGKLAACGIIQTEKNILPKKADDYIFLKIRLFKAKHFVRVSNLFRFLFTPSLFYTLLISSLIYLITFIAIKNDFQFYNIFVNYEFVNFYGLILLSILFHELGHAAACSKFGVKHGDIGFGIYFLMPVFYADVSSAWRLNKYQRVIIDLGGVYMDCLFCVFLSIIYFFNHDILLVYVISVKMFASLLNLNPFLRFDGYWALVDLLGLPNLKKDSDNKVRLMFKELISERKIKAISGLLVYGILNWGIMITFLLLTFIYNYEGILFFPYNLYVFFFELVSNYTNIQIAEVQQSLVSFIMPFFIYYICLRWFFSWINKSSI